MARNISVLYKCHDKEGTYYTAKCYLKYYGKFKVIIRLDKKGVLHHGEMELIEDHDRDDSPRDW